MFTASFHSRLIRRRHSPSLPVPLPLVLLRVLLRLTVWVSLATTLRIAFVLRRFCDDDMSFVSITVAIISGRMVMISPPLLTLLSLSIVVPTLVEGDVVVVVVGDVVDDDDDDDAIIVDAAKDVRLDLLLFLFFLVCDATITLCRTANGGIEEW
jgi:hypothetical protein